MGRPAFSWRLTPGDRVLNILKKYVLKDVITEEMIGHVHTSDMTDRSHLNTYISGGDAADHRAYGQCPPAPGSAPEPGRLTMASI